MIRVFTQSDNKDLNTGAKVTVEYDIKSQSSNIFVTSKKILENPDFDKPLKK
tara:strand:+ start:44 stop:199 length:156 start_codon:yes stop_codon:yes gene_type:complete